MTLKNRLLRLEKVTPESKGSIVVFRKAMKSKDGKPVGKARLISARVVGSGVGRITRRDEETEAAFEGRVAEIQKGAPHVA